MKETKKLKDTNIREPLFAFLEKVYGRIRILEEKRTGEAVADVVMVTEGGLYGIEIKSDADTYTRLKKQVENYDQFYDYNILVVGSSHAAHCEEHVPEHWGIITVEWEERKEQGKEEAVFYVDCYYLRKPKENPCLLPEKKLSLLWRPELWVIQEKLGLPAWSTYSKDTVRKKLLERAPGDKLWPLVNEALFDRDYEKSLATINAYREKKGLKKRRNTRKRRGRATKTVKGQ